MATRAAASAPPDRTPRSEEAPTTPRGLWHIAKAAVVAWADDYAPSMGAAIAYYTAFSIAPLLVLVIAIVGAVFGAEAAQGHVSAQLSGLLGKDAADAVQTMIRSASGDGSRGLAGAISIVVLLVGATSVFAEIQSALDRIWKVPEAEKPSGVWGILRARLLSFGLILGLAFLLMVSLTVSAALAAFGKFVSGLMPGEALALGALNLAVSLGVETLLFAMIYKLMPSTPISWRDVWVGAGVTAVLFEIGKFAIGLYLGRSGMAGTFGAAGSFVVLLAWVYYAAQVFLLGAEFTQAWSQARGGRAAARAQANAQRAQVPTKSGDPGPAKAAAAAQSPSQSPTQSTTQTATQPRAQPAVVAPRPARPAPARLGTGPEPAAGTLATLGTLAAVSLVQRLAKRLLEPKSPSTHRPRPRNDG